MKKFMGLVFAAAVLAAPGAGAATRDSISQEELAEVLREAGASEIEQGRDSADDPTIVATLHGSRFQAIMYDCDGDDRCTSIQFRSGYDLDDGMTAEALNEWNVAMRYGNAWLDEVDDPYIELDLDLSAGSTDGQVRRYAEIWSNMMSGFQDYIGY